jgi:hypothetical protein
VVWLDGARRHAGTDHRALHTEAAKALRSDEMKEKLALDARSRLAARRPSSGR